MVNNLKDLNIKVNRLFIDRKSVGTYDIEKNKIVIKEGEEPETLYHELFHMVSSTTKNDTCYCGFEIYSKKAKYSIGLGLTEGYTELLSKRYFGDIENLDSYEFHVHIIKHLEQIVGKYKLESLYLTSNLHGLIKELEKYSDTKSIMKFISCFDFLLNHLYDGKYPYKPVKNYSLDAMKQISVFLIKCYINKVINLKGLNESKKQELINRFINSLGNDEDIKSLKEEYLIIDKNEENIKKV